MKFASSPATATDEVAPAFASDTDIRESVIALLAAHGLEAVNLPTLPILAVGQSPLFFVDESTAFAPLSSDNLPATSHTANLEHAARLLDSFDALLCSVEAALGISLEARSLALPVETVAARQDVIALLVSDDENRLGLLLSASHPKTASWAHSATLLPPDLNRLLLAVELHATIARLPVGELSELESGDVILLPSSMPAQIALQHGSQFHSGDMPGVVDGRYSAANGVFTRNAAPDEGAPQAAFNAPLKMTLPLGKLPAMLLASQDNPVIALAALGPGTELTLSVGGKALANAEVIELAGQLAVILHVPVASGADEDMADTQSDIPATEGE